MEETKTDHYDDKYVVRLISKKGGVLEFHNDVANTIMKKCELPQILAEIQLTDSTIENPYIITISFGHDIMILVSLVNIITQNTPKIPKHNIQDLIQAMGYIGFTDPIVEKFKTYLLQNMIKSTYDDCSRLMRTVDLHVGSADRKALIRDIDTLEVTDILAMNEYLTSAKKRNRRSKRVLANIDTYTNAIHLWCARVATKKDRAILTSIDSTILSTILSDLNDSPVDASDSPVDESPFVDFEEIKGHCAMFTDNVDNVNKDTLVGVFKNEKDAITALLKRVLDTPNRIVHTMGHIIYPMGVHDTPSLHKYILDNFNGTWDEYIQICDDYGDGLQGEEWWGAIENVTIK
jgi:hypothetical protein